MVFKPRMRFWASAAMAALALILAGPRAGAQASGSDSDKLRTPNTFDQFVARLEQDYQVKVERKAANLVTDYAYYDITDLQTRHVYNISFSPSVDSRREERDMESQLRSALGFPDLSYDDAALDACYSAAKSCACGGRNKAWGSAAILTKDGAAEQRVAGRIAAADGGVFRFVPNRR